jgi:long-subunit fatty acid transport protein
MMAQSAMDGFQFSQPDLKGTARFMSMGGAFGALGADMTVLNQNPGGIGVYRSSEIGFTVDLDAQSSTANAQNQDYTTDQTKFYLNNIGFISTIKFDNSALKNFNIGFTYNKTSSFNRRYSGGIANLSNSMSNYIAGVANNNGVTEGDVTTTNTFDPYNPNDGGYEAPWITILGYDSYLINPENVNDNTTNWYGQWNSGTSGSGNFSVEERGSMAEYNIALGGNFNNFLYWGMDFGIVDLQYDQYTSWGENLKNAYVDNTIADNRWALGNSYSVSGTGFNYKLGFIVKPIQELRIGFAVHTPTWYNLKESFIGSVDYMYPKNNYAVTNNGYTGEYEYDFRTPWRFILSAAGVIEGRMIVSADYEFTDYQYMHFTDKYTSDYWDWSSNQYTDAYYYTNQDVKDYYQQQHSFRFGLEYRLTRNFSVRAGYCFVSSPVKQAAKDNKADIYTAGTRLSYAFDNNTNYVTCGLGYKNKGFALDLAYVYKTRESIFHAYPSDMDDLTYVAPSAKITSDNHQVVMSMSYKF